MWASAMAVVAFTAEVTTNCRPSRLSTLAPVSGVAAMAACTALRLASVTPVMPRVCSWARVGAVPPAAPTITACTAWARTCSSSTLSALARARLSTVSLSKRALEAAPTALAPGVTLSTPATPI
jgi:hypothetical protein